MRFYHTDGVYYATKAQAVKAAREASRQAYGETQVQLVSVSTSKENVLRMLNSEGGDTLFLEVVASIPGKLI